LQKADPVVCACCQPEQVSDGFDTLTGSDNKHHMPFDARASLIAQAYSPDNYR